MTSSSTTRVLDAGGPLFLHEHPPYDPMPACGRGVCVEMPATVTVAGDPLLVALRHFERHDGGPVHAELERFDVAVSLATGQCSPRTDAAKRLLDESPWVAAALASQLEELRRRARRLVAQRDRSSYRAAIHHATPGAMLPYDRLFPHDWDLIFGCDGHHVWACDQHCPNAACDCREIVVIVYDLNTPDTRSIGQLRIDLRSGNPRSNASSPSAAGLFEPLWAKHGAELIRRHHEVRQAVVAHATSRRDTTRPANPGRNAPCPCGSGKKFKNCCGKAA
jgi:SEC-C motif-containing protein